MKIQILKNLSCAIPGLVYQNLFIPSALDPEFKKVREMLSCHSVVRVGHSEHTEASGLQQGVKIGEGFFSRRRGMFKYFTGYHEISRSLQFIADIGNVQPGRLVKRSVGVREFFRRGEA